MNVVRTTKKSTDTKRRPPAKTPEAYEKRNISLAVELAEKQLAEGTASSQIIVHYLKLATEKERLEREKMQLESEMLRAKTKAIESQQHVEELYANAIEAMRSYSGASEDYYDD